VREALKQLREEGLVREEPRRGAFVAGLTIQDLRDIYDLRAALEIRAVTLIIRNSDSAVLDALRRALGRIEAAAASADLAELAKSDYEFHETVTRMSGNPRLHDAFVRNASALRSLLQLEADRFYESFEVIWAQHRDLLDALIAGDSDRAVALFTQHIEEARDRLMGSLSNPPASTR
jgi:DNA-binding GntR family transcriptional regulator